MLRWLSGEPQNTVLAVQFSGQGPSCQALVLLILGEPCRVFALAVKACTEPNVSSNVMNRSEPVVRPREAIIEDRVTPFIVDTRRGYFKLSFRAHCLYQFVVTRIGHGASSENNANSTGPAYGCKERVRLGFELGVRR